jgi:hypothetical protein
MIVNPFDQDAFNLMSLSMSINTLPNRYGRTAELGIFPERGVRSRQIVVDERNGVLTLLPSLPVGSPGTADVKAGRSAKSFTIPHIPLDGIIKTEEYQNLRAFGSESEIDSVAKVVNDRLAAMKQKHLITLEWLRMGALKGIILDGDYDTTLYNLYTEFSISPKSVDFLLGTAGTDVQEKCREVVRHIEDNLKGDVSDGVRALCSPEFFDKLIKHDSVKDMYKYHVGIMQKMAEGDPYKGFNFGGMVFEEYRAKCNDINGVSRKFITAQEGHAYPTGTLQTFQTVFAPGDFTETVGTEGLPYYAKIEMRKFNRGADLHTQSNPLAICCRPAVLVKVHTSN